MIAANIRHLIDSGWPRRHAIAEAHEAARRAYWRKFPSGFLPPHVYPDPESGRNNPKRGQELEMDGASPTHASRSEGSLYAPRGGARRNPAPRLMQTRDARKAASFYERFVGRPPEKSEILNVPPMPAALVCFSKIVEITYEAERDGKIYHFRHKFKVSSRPPMCVSPDGKIVYILGDGWEFTEDGFEDR